MKKSLLPLFCATFTIVSARADVLYNETFDYTNGSIIVTSTNVLGGTNWFRHSGSASPSDAIVANGKLQISATGGTPVTRQDDINRPFTTFTNTQTLLYSSFLVNCTNLPPAVGTYFAHFYVNSSTFHSRIFAQAGVLRNTWRLGISGAAGTPSKVFPVDLTTNLQYQVVVQWDPASSYSATLWVNPISSTNFSVSSIDAVATPAASVGFGFRQGSSFGNFFATVDNLVVATTFDEAATNALSNEPTDPLVITQPSSGTNFPGETVNLSAVVAGQGLGGLDYRWLKDGSDFTNPNGNSNALTLVNVAVADSGNYQLVVTTPYSLSVTTAVASLWVTNSPIAPIILQQPTTNNTVFFHQNVTLKVTAIGPLPLTYQWYYTNSPAVGANVSGSTSDTLVITDVLTNNGTTGAYRCLITSPFGTTTSTVATVNALIPPSVTIGALRTFVDPVFYLPTNTTALWTATGIVTTYTNITTSGNSSFFMQDGTGGINVFFGGAPSVFPQAGDSVTVVGPLGNFNSLLEMNLSTADPAHSIVTNSSGNVLPAAVTLPFSFTNTPSASNAIRFVQGSRVTLTNVYFPSGFPGTNTYGSGVNVTVSNSAGATFAVRVDSRVGDIIGKPVPPYGWTITGPMSYFLAATDTNRSAGFQILPTRIADIVSQKPSSITIVGGNPVLNWAAGPNVPYSVWRADDDVSAAFVSIASGLSFPTTNGVFTDLTATSTNAYYKITSP